MLQIEKSRLRALRERADSVGNLEEAELALLEAEKAADAEAEAEREASEDDPLYGGYDNRNKVINVLRAYYDVQLREGEALSFTLPDAVQNHEYVCPVRPTLCLLQEALFSRHVP